MLSSPSFSFHHLLICFTAQIIDIILHAKPRRKFKIQFHNEINFMGIFLTANFPGQMSIDVE